MQYYPAVLNAMYLIGSFFHPGRIQDYQPYFLARARRYMLDFLREWKPEEVLGFIEANSLLACYCYFSERWINVTCLTVQGPY